MNQQQLLLTQLLGSKELTFGCLVRYKESKHFHKSIQRIGETLWGQTRDNACIPTGGQTKTEIGYHIPKIGTQFQLEIDEIIGHKPTIADLHKWMNKNNRRWKQDMCCFQWMVDERGNHIPIPYDSSKDLLDQSSETLAQIIELITNK